MLTMLHLLLNYDRHFKGLFKWNWKWLLFQNWLSFGNRFNSREEFVLHSRDKIDRLKKGILTHVVFNQTRMRHLPQTAQFAIFNLELIPEWLVLDKILFQYHVSKYREMYEDGMNLFQSEFYSDIMSIVPNYRSLTWRLHGLYILFSLTC